MLRHRDRQTETAAPAENSPAPAVEPPVDNSAMIDLMPGATDSPPAVEDGATDLDANPDWAADLEPQGAATDGQVAASSAGSNPSSDVAPPAGGPIPADAVAWVDANVPVGLGVALLAQGTIGVGLDISLGGTLTAVNLGAGWIEVEASLSGGLGGGVGLGSVVGKSGAKVEAGVGVQGQTTRKFRVPWTRLADPSVVAGLAGSALAGSALAGILEALIGGHDLTPFLMEETVEGGVSAGGESLAELAGQGVDVNTVFSDGASIDVSYDDLADETGNRDGQLTIGGEITALQSLALDGSAVIPGADLSLLVPQITAAGAIVVPFHEVDGVKTFELPWYRLEVGGAVPVVAGGFVAGLGPDHVEVGVHGEIGVGAPIWQAALDAPIGSDIERATGGIVETQVAGSMSLSLGMSLDHALIPEAAEIVEDVAHWIMTGQASDVIANRVDLLEDMLAGAHLELGVDLTLIGLDAAGELTADEGIEVGGSGEASASLVYQRDDVIPDMTAPPSIEQALAALRSSGRAA